MELLNREQVAATFGCHPKTAFDLCRKWDIPVLRLGHRTTRVRAKDLEAGLERMATGQVSVHLAALPEVGLLAGKTSRAGVKTGPRPRRRLAA